MAKTNKGRKLFATTATAALVASAIVPVASAAQINDFNTISSYAQEAVQDLVDRGVIQGDEKGNFNPRKSVTRAEAATILVNALELESTGSINFTDVKAGAWYYDAINAAVNNGIFQGQGAGKFNPSGNLTRSEAAIILVDAFGLEGSASLSQFSDSASVKAWAQEDLEIAVANGVIKGDNGKLNPNAPITRQDFAVMYSRTEGVEAPVSGAIKAINNTTVEVTFEEPVTDLAEINFAIDGLTVSNKVLKQTDSSTVVLTTSAQEAGKTYVLSVDGEEVGSFTGVASVIPTAVKTTVASQQGVIGKEVTLSAEVTVAEGQSKAGIPVTFNITTDDKNNSKIEVEALTNDKGVATYSYTRYYKGIDSVVAYSTSKSSVKDDAKVYWASALQLTIKEAKEGNTVANNSKKVYDITGTPGSVVFVAFEENLGVKSNKVVDVAVTSAAGYIDEKDDYYAYKSTKDLTPYELSTGGAQYVVIELDNKGKGSLIITGEDASVTPVVYNAEDTGKLNLKKLDENQEDVAGLDVAYSKLLLQDKAATVKFDKNDILQLEVKALGTEDAAQVQADTLPADKSSVNNNDNGLGGRKYEVTVKNKAGEVAAAGTTAYVTFGEFEDTGKYQVIIDGKAYDIKAKEVYPIKVTGKEGKASFRVIGKGKKAYVTPTVFLNTEGSTSTPALDKKDIQIEAETTYFTAASVKEAVLTVEDEKGNEVTSLQQGDNAVAVYQSVDQNGFAYGTGKVYDVTFELTTTFGELKVDEKEKVQNVGKTYTYETKSDSNGRAEVKFTATSATTVDIDILGSRNVLPAKAATVKFTQYATGVITGVATNVDKTAKTFVINGSKYNYATATWKYLNGEVTRSSFEGYIEGNNATVSVTKDAESNFTFNVLSVGSTTNPSTVVDKVNAATTGAQVQAAISTLAEYKALNATDKATAVTAILTLVQAGTVTEADILAELINKSTTTFELASSGYTAVTPAVTAKKATGTSGVLTLTAKEVGTDLNGYDVSIVDTNTANGVISVDRDDSAKTITIDVANQPGGDITSTISEVLAKLSAEGLELTSTGTLTGTDFADSLVGATFALVDGAVAANAIPAEIDLTFTESVSAKVGDAVKLTLNNGTSDFVVTGTVATVSNEDVTITITAETPALVATETYTLKGLTGLKSFVDTAFTANNVNFTR